MGRAQACGRCTRAATTCARYLPDLAGALAYLAKQPGVDDKRVGVLGFSWGGVQAMLAASAPINDELEKASGVRPISMAAFYPVCWGYNRVPGYTFKHLAPARLLVLVGENDQYDDDPRACSSLISNLPSDRCRCTRVSSPR